ncbi:MAG: ABC transporter permease [Candidatus Microbacterium stercoravium]
MSTTAVTAPDAGRVRTFFSGGRMRELGILLALILVILAATAKNSNFLFSGDGWRDLLLTPAPLLLVTIGQAFVIITRNVDISVGSIVGLTAYMTGWLFATFPGIPIALVVVTAVLFGAFLGLVNGALVAFAKVPAMVITLGTLYAFRGINVLWTGSNRINPSDLPKPFLRFGTAQFLTIPLLTIVAVVVLLVAAWYLKNMRSGRELYAIGSDPEAANLYGLKTTRRVLPAFILSGTLSGLAGVFYAARYGTIDSQAATGWEFSAIGAAVIGGVAIVGGVGTVWGAAIGAVLLITINRALPILGIADFWQQAVVGVLIIGAIVLDRVLARRQKRRLIEARDDS